MAGAEKVIGRKSSRVRVVAKPWWSPALTSAEKARKALFQQWKKEGRVGSLVAKARLLKAKRAYKALIRKRPTKHECLTGCRERFSVHCPS